MTIRLGETGKRFYVITSFDMSSNTSLVIRGVPPSGEVNQKTWTATIGGAISNVTLEDGTVVTTAAANESMYYDFAPGDLDEAGVWKMVGVYTNTAANPDDNFISNPVEVTILDDNFAA